REAAIAARRSAEAARHAAGAQVDMPDVAEIVRVSMESARAELAATCAAQGVKMPADADFGALATCGNHIQEMVFTSLREARAEIAQDRGMSAEVRAKALAGIDRAIASNARRTTHD
ncbi:hypothetical protein, partial [Sphingomonas bacterium]|uniref:hypothetical protein n=1 Tax=Sphingomonas bacterium TaxID=1895847 RepID=UPI0015769438